MSITEMIGDLIGGSAGAAVTRQFEKSAIDRIRSAPDEDKENTFIDNMHYLDEGKAAILKSNIDARKDQLLGSDIAKDASEGRIPDRLPVKSLEQYGKLQTNQAKIRSDQAEAAHNDEVGRIVQRIMGGGEGNSLHEVIQEMNPDKIDDVIDSLTKYERMEKTHNEAMVKGQQYDDAVAKNARIKADAMGVTLANAGIPITDNLGVEMTPETLLGIAEHSPEMVNKKLSNAISFKKAADDLAISKKNLGDPDKDLAMMGQLAKLSTEITQGDQYLDHFLNAIGAPNASRDPEILLGSSLGKELMGGMTDIIGGRVTQAEFEFLKEAFPTMDKNLQSRLGVIAKMQFNTRYKMVKHQAMIDIYNECVREGKAPPIDIEAAAVSSLRQSGTFDALTRELQDGIHSAMIYGIKIPKGSVAFRVNGNPGTKVKTFAQYEKIRSASPKDVLQLKSNLG